jgi:hypothetical protein
MPWLDRRYCSTRCRTLDINQARAHREVASGQPADRADFQIALGQRAIAIAGDPMLAVAPASRFEQDFAAMKRDWVRTGRWT